MTAKCAAEQRNNVLISYTVVSVAEVKEAINENNAISYNMLFLKC